MMAIPLVIPIIFLAITATASESGHLNAQHDVLAMEQQWAKAVERNDVNAIGSFLHADLPLSTRAAYCCGKTSTWTTSASGGPSFRGWSYPRYAFAFMATPPS